jgi:hypothetical protein
VELLNPLLLFALFFLGLLGKHLGHAQSIYQNAEGRLEQFGQKLTSADADPKELLEPRAIERKTG